MSEDQKRQIESQLWGISYLIGRNLYLIQETFLTTINTVYNHGKLPTHVTKTRI
jgi:hypothetical protein